MMPGLGEPAPVFTAPTRSNPRFAFSSVAGRFVLLGFLPSDAGERRAVLEAVSAGRNLLNDTTLAAFLVVRDPAAAAADGAGLRWFLDQAGAVSRLYGALTEDGNERPGWLLLDPALRVLMLAPMSQTAALFDRLRRLPAPDAHAGVPLHAPVLIVPRILEPALCRQLIELYERTGGQPSGVMRELNGRTVGVLDDFKKRRDASIGDPTLCSAIRRRIQRRLLPEIERAFQFRATRIERYIVACYDADEGGYFMPHRDNTTSGTAHRKFAVSINLNAEEFDGGDLRFPEFGSRTYRPPTGGAVVFSCSLLHEATPVTRGRRYATLPFLHDEAGEALRLRNLHHLRLASKAPPPSVPTTSHVNSSGTMT